MTTPGRGGVLQKAKCFLIVLVTISLVTTFHLGDTLTWFWSRTRVNTDEHFTVASLGEEKSEHLSVREYFNKFKVRHLPQLHNEKSESVIAPSQGSGPPTSGWGSHLTASLHVTESFNGETIAWPKPGNKTGFVTIVVRGTQHYKHDVRTRFHHTEATLSTLYTTATVSTPHTTATVATPRQTATISTPHTTETVDQFTQEIRQEVTLASSRDLSSLKMIYYKLLQIEQASLVVPDVWVRGSLSAIKHHMPLVESAFQKFKVKVAYQTQDGYTEFMTWGGNHSIILCLNATDKEDNCVISDSPPVHGQVNVIPELLSVIMSVKLVCVQMDNRYHTTATSGQGQWYGGRLPCYTSSFLPDDRRDNCDSRWGWWLITNISSGVVGQYVPCDSFKSVNSRLRSGENILVPLPGDLLTLDGAAPLVWQAEVLVMSLSPARVYLHPAGIAWSGFQELMHRKHPKNTSLLDLEQLFTEMNKKNTAGPSITQLQSVLLDVVRSIAGHIGDKTRYCQKCFQQLEILLVFNSSFQPIVLQVIPRQYTTHLSSLSDYLLEQNILDDLAAMLVSRETTSVDLLWALSDFGVIYVRDEMICDANNIVCLGENEINFLLDTRREQKTSRNWIRLVPSSVVQCKMKHSLPDGGLQIEQNERKFHDFESLLLLLEGYYLCPVHTMGKQKSTMTVPVQRGPADVSFGAELSSGLLTQACDSGMFLSVPKYMGCYAFTSHIGCWGRDGGLVILYHYCVQLTITDNSSWPYLSAIHTYPYIQLFPEFSPLNTDYRAQVNYETTLIQLAGVAKHCRAEVRLLGRNSRWTNFILGLGDNTANILIVNMDHSDPIVHNVYKIIINRKHAGQIFGFAEHKGDYQVCSLKQDCSLPFSRNMTCDLQPVLDVVSWTQFVQQHLALPQCADGSGSGEWMVPCLNCQNESSCYWKQAIWQPLGCREGLLDSDKFKDCLFGKRVLFIGDSTNRGILHYIFQRLNGSLFEWDKTHSIRTYTNLNDGLTIFGFAYYPQFWHRPGVRPGLDKTLHQLLNRTAVWSDRETVIVLGGVHWLGKHHLDILVETLRRDRPSKWTVIVKGLGAGFHQPIHGVHLLSLEDQQQLMSHNQAVLSYARSLGFLVVDTFSMTMSRFRDFLQGKCACHFHQVSTVEMSAVEKFHSAGAGDSQEAMYHIEGDINAAYSEMVINRMCIHRGR